MENYNNKDLYCYLGKSKDNYFDTTFDINKINYDILNKYTKTHNNNTHYYYCNLELIVSDSNKICYKHNYIYNEIINTDNYQILCVVDNLQEIDHKIFPGLTEYDNIDKNIIQTYTVNDIDVSIINNNEIVLHTKVCNTIIDKIDKIIKILFSQ